MIISKLKAIKQTMEVNLFPLAYKKKYFERIDSLNWKNIKNRNIENCKLDEFRENLQKTIEDISEKKEKIVSDGKSLAQNLTWNRCAQDTFKFYESIIHGG